MLQHKGTKYIETERLILRRFAESDLEAMFYNWENSEEVTKFLCWTALDSMEAARGILEDWLHQYGQDDFYQWAIVPKELNEPIGTISVVEMNEDVDMVQIGYCIGTKWWNQGFTSEAFGAIIPFFFQEAGVNRIEARHDPNNPNSGRVMKKCGLQYEGTLRQARRSNRGIVDDVVYGLLKSEWESAR